MGGKKSAPPAPEKVDPVAQAQAQVDAQIAARPRAAKAEFDILTNPEFGAQATTQLFEDIRKQVFPNEQAVREQLVQNTLGQLQSPTGLTPEQQAAIDARRGVAVENFQRQQRGRANLGGGLFGGRSQLAEQRGVAELETGFAEEDINREERARLNNAQLALSIAQILFPGAQLQTPQFIDPVASPNVAFQGAVTQAGQTAQLASDQAAQQAALRSSLFNALGSAGGQGFRAIGQAKSGD